jgi:HSP20 family protein
MAIVRWEPVRELNSLQHEMNRLFGNFFDQSNGAAASSGQGRQWIPAMDLVETKDAYVLRADLPGLSSDDVKIELEDSVLTISGERKTQQEQRTDGYYRFERASGSFARSLTLPQGIDAERIEARFADGVLEITIPLPEQRKPRRVSITTAGQAATVEGSEASPEPSPELVGSAA